MIYKVSEVVKELGVSRQTVYKKLRREAYKPYIGVSPTFPTKPTLRHKMDNF